MSSSTSKTGFQGKGAVNNHCFCHCILTILNWIQMDLVCRCSSPILRPSHHRVEQIQTANGEDSKVPSDRVYLPDSRRQCWREELLFRSKGCLGCIGHGWSAEDGRLDSSLFVCGNMDIITVIPQSLKMDTECSHFICQVAMDSQITLMCGWSHPQILPWHLIQENQVNCLPFAHFRVKRGPIRRDNI